MDERTTQTELNENTSTERFCTACGTKVSQDAVVCPTCEKTLVNEKLNDGVTAHKNKNILVISIVAIAAIALTFLIGSAIFSSIAADNIVGNWESDINYLSHYDCNARMYLTIFEDGSYLEYLVNAYNDKVLNLEYGNWEMDGSKAVLHEDGNPARTIYDYNLDGTISNGIWTYEKAE